ncbi:MAG: tRNA (N(6)-L-threonylcarbamoyladenosine(37)-C(2))-methylthiotransferase MtaB [Bacilli bacterium]|nr:tRNA (N(6)-L-threonylcarbamoyladenosine(37)-C(2))-methylthiotransferase MtaB [Bacilli bacterium]MDD4795279.1 tRNA (N(6)-L-threonylcarbamoyladenosine(37)-C(2))-methylthiotransferase MtaB [Bacilli bacterium]
MKVCIETLGCKVNHYESQVIKEQFENNNDIIVTINDNPDIVVINTCTVTNQSDSKSRKLIRQARRINPNSILIVCGCSSQMHQEELNDLEIDILLGNKDKSKILEYLQVYLNDKNKISKFYDLNKVDFEDMNIKNFSGRTRGFVKIQDGCNNYCSYCIIPYIRGNIRNKDFNSAVNEIKSLVKHGYKEIVLTGIHTGSYGKGTDYNLVSLIKEISKISDLEHIRISSIEITEITDEFLEELKNNSKICDHLHIPLQSGSNKVLKEMNRKYNLDKYFKIINKIRDIRPNINITTDLIVGFPTETEDDFGESIDSVKQLKFGKIHVFPYSKRDKTAAANMKNIVAPATKKLRSKEMIKISNILENEYYQIFLNKTLKILIEEVKEGWSIGHTSNYIKVKINKTLEPNTYYEAQIIKIDKEDVIGV